MAEAETTVPKPKKPLWKKWWFWAIVVVVVAAAASGGGGEDSPSTADNTPAATEPAATEPAATEPAATEPAGTKIGEALKVGDLVFTVVSATPTKELVSPLGNKSGNWMLVEATVENQGKEAITIDSSFFKLLEADGTVYETDSDSLMYLDSEKSFFLEKINPKMSATGQVLFAIPESATDLKLQVQTGAFGTEKGEIALTN